MRQLSLLKDIGALPPPFDLDWLANGMEDWAGLVAQLKIEKKPDLAKSAKALDRTESGRSLLASLFGNSPYLGHLLLRNPDLIREISTAAPDDIFRHIIDSLTTATAAITDPLGLMQPLRLAKQQVALLTAIADLGGVWSLEQVTGALSDFASIALQTVCRHLLREAAAAGDLALATADDPQTGSGLIVLAMGKLGARELNYSSDIDLIVLFDQDVARYAGKRTVSDCFVRMAQKMVRLLQERTADGYVFRTDLRLRPDPASTPLALSAAAAENYYESLGQNWERAAMIKARPIAGDIQAGQLFLQRITPFVWRKHLDFAAIEDIQSIKRQIHAHKGHGEIAIAGHNIKLGRGGIREIEFFAQTQQLIAGGRDRNLRPAGTCDAIRALAASGRVDDGVAREMIADYAYLRRLEHRLQMIADEQTHSLPKDAAELAHVGTFMGEPDLPRFEAAVRAVLERVKRHYDALFEQAPPLGSIGSLVFTGTDDDPDTIATLRKLGFHDPASVAATIRGWHHGRYRAMRSERARELLTALMPSLLEAMAATANPDIAFTHFDQFLEHLPAGIQLFSLFYANSGLLKLIAEIMGTAPRLAEQLGRKPQLIDGLLSPAFYGPLPDAQTYVAGLSDMLSAARDFQDVLDFSRRWVNDQRLQVGVHLLRGLADGESAGLALANIADAALQAILPAVEADFVRHHGRVAGGSVTVLGLGRLGGREMTFESDLDLIFIYGHGASAETSKGPKPLPVSQYFARLAQRLINAITAPTGEGRLYDVDMRLRPSGNAGPIATTLAAFIDYHRTAAWTWEHMALTRARTVAGPPAARAKVDAEIQALLRAPRDSAKLLADVAGMRRRLAAAKPGKRRWNLKYAPGGLVDLEFIGQYLQLRHAAAHPQVLDQHVLKSLGKMGEAGLLEPATTRELIEAGQFLSLMLALTRLVQPAAFDAEAASPGMRDMLAQRAQVADFAALEAKLATIQDCVHAHYERLVEIPALPYLSPE